MKADPVAIQTGSQGKGIGQKLIQYGLASLKEKGVALVLTYGDPDFYSKVGFRSISEKVVKAPLKLSYPEGWLGQSLLNHEVKPILADSHCVNAMYKPEYW